MNTQTDHPEPGLHDEMHAVEARHPLYHWHVWISDGGSLYAACPYSEEAYGSGTTLGPGTCEGLDRAIAAVEYKWATAA